MAGYGRLMYDWLINLDGAGESPTSAVADCRGSKVLCSKPQHIRVWVQDGLSGPPVT